MSQVTDAITALTTAVDNLTANGQGGSSTDAADAAAINTQTARVVALTAPAGVPVVGAPVVGGLAGLIQQNPPATSFPAS
jgi:hypothetical protein